MPTVQIAHFYILCKGTSTIKNNLMQHWAFARNTGVSSGNGLQNNYIIFWELDDIILQKMFVQHMILYNRDYTMEHWHRVALAGYLREPISFCY